MSVAQRFRDIQLPIIQPNRVNSDKPVRHFNALNSPPAFNQNFLYPEKNYGAAALKQYKGRVKELTKFFDLHLKDRIQSGIGCVSYSEKSQNLETPHDLSRMQFSLENPFIYQGLEGLSELLLIASKIEKTVIENRFPNIVEHISDGRINPYIVLLNLIFAVGLDCLYRGYILAITESEGLNSIVPSEYLSNSKNSLKKNLAFLSECENLRFISVRDLAHIKNSQSGGAERLVSLEKGDDANAAVKLLDCFLAAFPGKRISAANAKPVIKKIYGIGKKGFEKRVWPKMKEAGGRSVGAIPNSNALSSEQLDNFYQENSNKYGSNN